MESADVAKLVKNQRANTMGETPQTEAPSPEAVKAAKEANAAGNQEKPKLEIAKGVTIGLDPNGKFVMDFVGNAPNYLELIAIFDYTNAKKNDIVEQLAGTGTFAARSQTANLTQSVNVLVEGFNKVVDEFTALKEQVNNLSK
jgi:hypothetical protein